MSTQSVVPAASSTIDPRLTVDRITIDPAADAYAKRKSEPHFYQRLDDGSWELPAWLAITLRESIHGDTQRAWADALLTYPGFELRADAAASCHHAWFPQKECAKRTLEGKKHMVVLAKTHCEMPTCPHCQDERERLDYFLARDKGDFWSACSEIINNCLRDGIKPMVARIRLTSPHAQCSMLQLRADQETMHTHVRNWRARITSKHSIPSSHYGMVLADHPSPEKAELWVLYIGPEIPFESLRDAWKDTAGSTARFWHSRRTGFTAHDTTCRQDSFEGMMEAELQTIFTLPRWMREMNGPRRAAMQVAFSRFRFIRQAGMFYGYRQPLEMAITAEQAEELAAQSLPVSDEELYELCNIPVAEVDCCVRCSSPLLPPETRRTGHLHDFHEAYDHVSLHTRRARQLHKHIGVSMCDQADVWDYGDSLKRPNAALSPPS